MAKPGTTTTKEPTYNKLTVVMCTAVLVTSSTCQVQFRFLITTLAYYRQTWKGKPGHYIILAAEYERVQWARLTDRYYRKKSPQLMRKKDPEQLTQLP